MVGFKRINLIGYISGYITIINLIKRIKFQLKNYKEYLTYI
jgi:hypothetical protein